METPTSDPYLPPEILDYIIDFLEGDFETLAQCCLVSKSWAPRARKHIFAIIVFEGEDVLELWKMTFPNPANSPSYHTHTLAIGCDPGDMEESGWIQGFPRVENLIVECEHWVDFSSFQKLAPSLKSLTVLSSTVLHTQIFGLIRSLPFLNDFAIAGDIIDDDESNESPVVVSTPPTLIATLYIHLSGGVGKAVSEFLGLPGCRRCRDLELGWCHESDLSQVAEVVAMCSDTLEYLDIGSEVGGRLDPLPWISRSPKLPSVDDDAPATIDLSKAANLKEVTFRCVIGLTGCRWIIMALETIILKHRDLRKISIQFVYGYDRPTDVDPNLIQLNEATKPGIRWSDLDSLLVQLFESRSIQPRIACPRLNITTQTLEDLARYLLPETAMRGTMEIFEEPWMS